MLAYKVTAIDKNTKKLLAEYIFDKMQDAIKFHSDMVGKGHESVLSRVQIQ